jgi:hypothetical protein
MALEPFDIKWVFLSVLLFCILMVLCHYYLQMVEPVRRLQNMIHTMAAIDTTIYAQCVLLLEPMYLIRTFIEERVDQTLEIEPNV